MCFLLLVVFGGLGLRLFSFIFVVFHGIVLRCCLFSFLLFQSSFLGLVFIFFVGVMFYLFAYGFARECELYIFGLNRSKGPCWAVFFFFLILGFTK